MQSQNILNTIINSQKNINYIFIDFFDTIVHRKCSPDTIKQMWALELEKELKNTITAKELYQLRIESEQFLHNKKIEENYNILSHEICKRLLNASYIHDESEIEYFSELMKKTEIKVEKSMQYKDNTISHLLFEFKKRGYHIIIISDFYLEARYIKEFCKNCGVEDCFDEIFVSCECEKSKAKGNIYPYIINKLNVKAKDCLMIGDNYKCDIKNAKIAGCNTYYRKYKKSKNIISQKYIETKLNHLFNSSVHTLYDGYAYSLYYFIETLYYHLKKDNVKNILFFSREGEFLKKLFDYYLRKIGDKSIYSHYCFISRKSSFLASLNDLNNEKFDTYFRQFSTSNLIQFLKNIDFNEDELSKIQNALSIDEKEMKYVHSELQKSEIFKLLLNNNVFRRIYEEKVHFAKNNLNAYFQSFKIDWYKNGMFIVDVGWKGTIQDNIFHFFEEKIHIRGYYLGLCELTNVSVNNLKTGILFSKVPYKSTYCEQLSGGYLLYEKILMASHPSTIGYSKTNNEIKPIFDFKEYESQAYLQVEVIQKNIYDLYIQILNIFSNSCFRAFDLKKFFALIQIKTFMKITKKDIKLWNYLEDCHYENFGVLVSQKELREIRGKKYYLEKYKKYLKENIRLFSSEHYLRTVLRLDHLHLNGLIFIYKFIVYILEKIKIGRELN